MPVVKIKKLNNYKGGNIKTAYKGDAGLDLYATKRTYIDNVGEIDTGIAVEIPEGYCGLIMEKSGLGKKLGLSCVGRVIDSGYRGEVKVLVSTKTPHRFNAGNKVAQMIVVPCVNNFKEVNKLSNSERGDKGFGSSGI